MDDRAIESRWPGPWVRTERAAVAAGEREWEAAAEPEREPDVPVR
ncbi:hypothetical protein [Streptomyces lydicus]